MRYCPMIYMVLGRRGEGAIQNCTLLAHGTQCHARNEGIRTQLCCEGRPVAGKVVHFPGVQVAGWGPALWFPLFLDWVFEKQCFVTS